MTHLFLSLPLPLLRLPSPIRTALPPDARVVGEEGPRGPEAGAHEDVRGLAGAVAARQPLPPHRQPHALLQRQAQRQRDAERSDVPGERAQRHHPGNQQGHGAGKAEGERGKELSLSLSFPR